MQTLPHEKEIAEYEATLSDLRSKALDPELVSSSDLSKLEKKLENLKHKVYANLSPWERVQIARHAQRPHSIDYIEALFDDFMELSGDRISGDDGAVIAGFGLLDGERVAVVAQEKGFDIESRTKRNFGYANPEGFRKALRVMKLAEKLGIPVISLVDTPGAYAGLAAEEKGQGAVIATNLYEMARLKVPIIVLVIGEGASGGALALGVGDVIGMLEHSYYSVISPEGCSSILWKDVSKKAKASEMLKLQAENLLENGLIDEILPEPLGGAHHDPVAMFKSVKTFLLSHLIPLKKTKVNVLVEKRYEKFRKMGKFKVVG